MNEYQPAPKTKRFIAGTRCPQCSKEDTTMMYSNEAGDDVRECVECGFIQTLTEQLEIDDAKAAELATRVTPDGKAVLDEGETALKIVGFMDPSEK